MININKYNLFSPKQIGKESENMYSVQSRYEFENRIIWKYFLPSYYLHIHGRRQQNRPESINSLRVSYKPITSKCESNLVTPATN